MIKALENSDLVMKKVKLFFSDPSQTMYKINQKTGISSQTLGNYKKKGDGKWSTIARICNEYPTFIYCFVEEIPEEKTIEVLELQKTILNLQEKIQLQRELINSQRHIIDTYIKT